jgi:hypothetical protein
MTEKQGQQPIVSANWNGNGVFLGAWIEMQALSVDWRGNQMSAISCIPAAFKSFGKQTFGYGVFLGCGFWPLTMELLRSTT